MRKKAKTKPTSKSEQTVVLIIAPRLNRPQSLLISEKNLCAVLTG
jgi:hypothetical protein